MKSLKRTLCLVLALVMVLGLFGIASATNFTDDNTIQYKEAVDVMTGIGAINGMGDGTFNPKGTITRAQAAKLVTYAVLGKATAERLTGVSSSFTDVTVDGGFGWAIPSIEYLVREGVINGRGDGTFDPNGEISGTATLKMLLCALGYGKKGEYTGTGWDLQATLDANKLGITTGRVSTASIDAPATREEVALYCLNTIQKDTVKYYGALDVYHNNAEDGSSSIMETVYGATNGDLTKTPATSGLDAYGHPANEWTYNGEPIGAYAVAATKTYTKAVTTVASDLEGYTLKDSSVTPVVNKASADQDDIGNLDGIEALTGNGKVVEIFANNSKVITNVVVTETTLDKVVSLKADNAATTTKDEREIELENTTLNAKAAEKPAGFDAVYSVAATLLEAGKDVPVKVVTDNAGKVLSVGIPETVDATVSSVKTNTEDNSLVSFVAGGKTYETAVNYAALDGQDIEVKNTYTLLMDDYGYVLGSKKDAGTENVGVVTVAGQKTDGFKTIGQLKILGLDGKEIILPTLDGNVGPNQAGTGYESDFDFHFVTYRPDSANEGLFTVEAATAGLDFNDQSAKTIKVVTGKAALTDNAQDPAAIEYESATQGTDVAAKANAATVFIVETIDNSVASYTTYIGIDKVPSLTGTNCAIYDKQKDGFAEAVFVKDATIEGAGTSGLSFIIVDRDKTIKTEKGNVWEGALITGAGYGNIKAVQVAADEEYFAATDNGDFANASAAVITGYTEKDGVITKVAPFVGNSDAVPGAGQGIDKAKNGVITFGEMVGQAPAKVAHTYTTDCVVWVIDDSKTVLTDKFVPSNIAALATDANDMVVYVAGKDNGQLSAVYVIKVADDAPGGGEGGGGDTPHNHSYSWVTANGEDATASNNTVTDGQHVQKCTSNTGVCNEKYKDAHNADFETCAGGADHSTNHAQLNCQHTNCGVKGECSSAHN